MAVRLNVIMVHSPPATATAQRVSESIVGELIGRPGIDLALVGPLDQIHDGSTDQLSLESITSDAAVLDWRSPGELHHALAAIGFTGTRWPHRHDADAAGSGTPNAGRKIYAFNLNEFSDAKDLCVALADLLASRQVTTFSLAGPTTTGFKTAAPSPTAPSPTAPSTTAPSTTAASTTAAASYKPPATETPAKTVLDSATAKPSAAAQNARQSNTAKGNRRVDVDLDDLVDQLDKFDP